MILLSAASETVEFFDGKRLVKIRLKKNAEQRNFARTMFKLRFLALFRNEIFLMRKSKVPHIEDGHVYFSKEYICIAHGECGLTIEHYIEKGENSKQVLFSRLDAKLQDITKTFLAIYAYDKNLYAFFNDKDKMLKSFEHVKTC